MVSTQCKFHLFPNRVNDQYIPYASKQLASYDYWTANNQKISLCKWIFFDLHHLIYMMMTRIRSPNLWIKTVSIMRDTNIFGIIFIPTLQKNSSFKIGVHISIFTSFALWCENCIYKWLVAKQFYIFTPKNSLWTSDQFTEMCQFHWLCIHWSWHSCSTVPTFVEIKNMPLLRQKSVPIVKSSF